MVAGVWAFLLLAGAGSGPPAGGVAAEAALAPRRLVAKRLSGPAPVIDGRLDEPAWAEAETASDLVQRQPEPGALSRLRTEARVLYDADALYVGVRLYDPKPETITAPYPRRDDEITSDWAFVEIDSRHDRRTGFSFGVNPRGVQADGAWFGDSQYDSAWNGVWESAARIDAEGWQAEFRIPFSQLVYTAEDPAPDGTAAARFGINVYRYNPSRGESSNWSPRLPSLAGIVSHFNELLLRVPARRPRLELAPYASTTASGGRASASGGLDLRAGLGPAFTVTGALHPDFGQVEADPSEVNLTTFETLFSERRPLFVENAGLFAFDLGLPLVSRDDSFAAESAFYSRRIGRPPRLRLPEGVTPLETPESATLLGAAKLTGRTATGWSVGGLYALTGSESARYLDAAGSAGTARVEPVTQFALARVSRDFRGGASAVGGFASLVDRSGMTPELEALLPERSLAAGLDARHRFGGGRYEATGFLVGSRVEGSPEAVAGLLRGPGHYTQRPDAPHLDTGPPGPAASGFAAQARIARVGGEHWRFALAGRAASPRLELNDAGFQRNADWLVAFASLGYQQDRPSGPFRRWAVGSGQLAAGWSFGGERRAAVVNLFANADLRSYWGGSLSYDHELPALQTEALRGGPALLLPSRDALALSLYTDSRRTSQLSLDVKGFREAATGSRRLSLAPTLSLRASDRLALSLGPSFEWTTDGWHYVGTAVAAGSPHYVLGRLEQATASLTARLDLAFSPRLSLQLYAQPFASRGRFDELQQVAEPRAARTADRLWPFGPGQVAEGPAGLRLDLGPDGSALLPDPSYRVRDLRANLVLRWEYRPGSTLFVVWSQDRHADLAGEPGFAPGRELLGAFDAPPRNTLLVKLSYWFAPRH